MLRDRYRPASVRPCTFVMAAVVCAFSVTHAQAQPAQPIDVVVEHHGLMLASHHTQRHCGNGPCDEASSEKGARGEEGQSTGGQSLDELCAQGLCGEVEPAEPSTVRERQKKPADD